MKKQLVVLKFKNSELSLLSAATLLRAPAGCCLIVDCQRQRPFRPRKRLVGADVDVGFSQASFLMVDTGNIPAGDSSLGRYRTKI